MNSTNSYVIGDRETDLQLAENMGISGLRYQRDGLNWTQIAKQLTQRDRHAYVNRVTKETAIDVNVWLDREGGSKLNRRGLLRPYAGSNRHPRRFSHGYSGQRRSVYR